MKRINSEKISSKEMAILDNNSEWLGIPKSHLMECAGYSVAKKIINRKYLGTNDKVAIFCGTGNNGGDGFVVARHLSSYGVKVLVILVGDPGKIRTEEAKLNWNIIYNNLTYSVDIEIIKDSKELVKIKRIINKDKNFAVIVDGLLGTGVEGKIREPIASAIDLINDIKKEDNESITVVSIDVPSGLEPNSGSVSDKAVKADLVITFHNTKKGLSCSSAYINEIIERSIGIPPEASLFVGKGDLIQTSKRRIKDVHKGQFGRMLVIGGSKDYSGAPAYSSLTGINFGIDLVITYVPEVVGDVIRSYSPNMIVRTNPGNWLNIESFNEISELIEWSNAIVIGPGLGKEKETKELLIKLLEKMNTENKNYVLDADALKLVKGNLDLLKNKNVILTPHKGELKIMTGIELPVYDEIDERKKVILNLAQELGVTLLIKGPYDYISDGKNIKINRTGCPEMSIGGTGDVLAGLCACFLATDNTIFQSACSAAFLNGIIGEYCKAHIGERFTTMDMVNNINNAVKEILNI
ncbi:MAG: NAD(P)H-hydrate dehydratase [Candidatus Thorarchaeota archaeon]